MKRFLEKERANSLHPTTVHIMKERTSTKDGYCVSAPVVPGLPSVLQAFPHPVMVLDDAFRIVAMNRLMEALTGYGAQKVLGFHGELVIRSNVGNSRGQIYIEVLKTGEAVSVKGDILTSYRRRIPVQYTVSVLKTVDGERCGLMVVLEDTSAIESVGDSESIKKHDADLIGYSTKMQKVFDMIPLLAQTDASVLITGETGTGKDKVAELLHKKSARARFPFVKVNCGALPIDLLESELFGHVKGAFTGATRDKPGMFKLADKGTLFLTEIGDMPLSLQVKLLSVLDDRQFIPVGGESKVHVDVRIIAATHRPLREQVRKGLFREDLFYRLNVLHLHLPPLREREGDIRYLLDYFLQKYAKTLGKTIVGFTPAALQDVLEYSYPGNIRELSNIVEYAVNMCKKKKVNREELPLYLFEGGKNNAVSDTFVENDETNLPKRGYYQEREREVSDENHYTWDDVERQMILDTLKQTRGNKTKAAGVLGWGRMTLWRKMQKYEL